MGGSFQSEPGETWREVDGFAGRYEVSDRGRVRRTGRVSHHGRLYTEVDDVRRRIEHRGGPSITGIPRRKYSGPVDIRVNLKTRVLRGNRNFNRDGEPMARTVTLTRPDGGVSRVPVSHLVWRAFKGEPEPKMIWYADGDVDNLRPENLNSRKAGESPPAGGDRVP